MTLHKSAYYPQSAKDCMRMRLPCRIFPQRPGHAPGQRSSTHFKLVENEYLSPLHVSFFISDKTGSNLAELGHYVPSLLRYQHDATILQMAYNSHNSLFEVQ